MPRNLRPCPVPGCDRPLSKDNKVSLVCEKHRHEPGYCQCNRCVIERTRAVMRPRPSLPPVGPASVRHTVAGVVRGCPTTVTADTREQAAALLGRLCHA